MKIKFWKYYYEDGRKIIMLLEAIGYKEATIIGGLRKNGHSNNDIDIHLSQTEYTTKIADHIMNALNVSKFEITDWGSLYLPNTIFGTLDIFFKGQTDDFDY